MESFSSCQPEFNEKEGIDVDISSACACRKHKEAHENPAGLFFALVCVFEEGVWGVGEGESNLRLALWNKDLQHGVAKL